MDTPNTTENSFEESTDATPVGASERERLEAERAELQDRLLRNRAEFDNYRRRVEREKLELLERGGMDVAKALLPALDDFDRAIQMTPKNDPAAAEVVKGMQLIHARLLETLKKVGLEPIESLGKPFNPHEHEAIERAETDEAEDQTVLSVFQQGYRFKGQLLRPAMVKVAVRP